MSDSVLKIFTRACPLCGEKASDKPEVEPPVGLAGMSSQQIQEIWNAPFGQKVFSPYHRCPACKFLFVPNFFTEETLNLLYERMPHNNVSLSDQAIEKTFEWAYGFLKPYRFSEGGYLEVGPDRGLFLKNCLKDESLKNFWLFEPNKTCWPDLEKQLQGRDFQLFDDMGRYDQVPDSSVSALVMIHVVDHVLDPEKTLRALVPKLKRGALALIVCHNEASLLAKMMGRSWPPYCLQHPHLYSPDTLKRLLHSVGFKILKRGQASNQMSLQFLVEGALKVLGIRDLSFPALQSIQIPLKLGNQIVVAQYNPDEK